MKTLQKRTCFLQNDPSKISNIAGIILFKTNSMYQNYKHNWKSKLKKNYLVIFIWTPKVDACHVRRNIHNNDPLQTWQLNHLVIALEPNPPVEILIRLMEELLATN